MMNYFSPPMIHGFFYTTEYMNKECNHSKATKQSKKATLKQTH